MKPALIFALLISSITSLAPAGAQTTAPPANATTVQIDNVNSTSKPDDVQIPEANPARPTFTNPAHIPPVGYVQFEQGIVQASASPSLGHQFSLSQVTKLAVHRRLMLELLSQPLAFTSAPDGSTRDAGDLDAAVQGLLVLEQGLMPTIALNYQHVLRAGSAPNLDIGSTTQTAALMVSGDIGDSHYDANFLIAEQSGPNLAGTTIRRAQHGETLSVTRPFLSSFAGDKLALTGELWHFSQPLPMADVHDRPIARANAVGTLVAVSYAVAPNLVFDAAVDHGLTSTSTQWQALAGFTYLLPQRLWSQRSTAPRPPRRTHIPRR